MGDAGCRPAAGTGETRDGETGDPDSASGGSAVYRGHHHQPAQHGLLNTIFGGSDYLLKISAHHDQLGAGAFFQIVAAFAGAGSPCRCIRC